MSQYQDVFKRYEKKYMLDDNQYVELSKVLKNRMNVDKYGQHTISNIYFDTDDYRLIRESIEKPEYKEKLRIRSYKVPGRKDTVFVELKKKYDKVVYKRRISMSLEEAENYLIRGTRPLDPCQILKEIDWFMKFYRPKPKLFIAYDRIATFGKENPNLRVTFDSNIRWRKDYLSLSEGNFGKVHLGSGFHLMEIKIPGAMPLWLSSSLADLGIFPISYSKYGSIYKANLMRNADWGHLSEGQSKYIGGVHYA